MFKSRRSPLRLETLDHRVVPSATASFNPVTQTVTITGDAADNVAVVSVQSGSVVVVADGTTSAYPASQVRNFLFLGGDGNDQFTNNTALRANAYGEAGNDTMTGGTGRDDLFGGLGDDILTGNAGDDKIYGSAGNDQIFGNDGKDDLRGEAGDDTILGGAGEDELRGGSGIDTMDGGAGKDRIRYNVGIDILLNPDPSDRLDRDRDGLFGTDDPIGHD